MKVARSRLDRAWICDLMNVLCDIETARNVKRLVDALYVKVNYDELLAPSRLGVSGDHTKLFTRRSPAHVAANETPRGSW